MEVRYRVRAGKLTEQEQNRLLLQADTWNSPTQLFRWTLALLLLVGASAYVVMSLHWPILWDTQVMHYVNFMMDHGREPYRDITDMNMPGAYLTERWAMHLFGGGDVAWRVYDYTLMVVLTTAMMWIARPVDWLGGLFAGVFFSLMHGIEGPQNAAQRDQVMTVLLMVGYVFLFAAMRRRRPQLLVVFGLAVGMAAAIKPTVGPFGLLLLAGAMLLARSRGEPMLRYALSGLAGLLAALGIVLAFLVSHHALSAFLYVLRDVIPHYTGIDRATTRYMIVNALPTPVYLMLLPGFWLAWHHRSWRRVETLALWAGAGFGIVSYYVQHKGFFYHRYTAVAFVLLWLGLEFTQALREHLTNRVVGAAALAFGTLFADTRYLHRIHDLLVEEKYGQYARVLESDLSQIGTARLQGRIECLDMVYGCLNALYHLRIVQNTGSTGDLLYFQPSHQPVVLHYRELFAQELAKNPPDMFVISNEWYGQQNSFAKIDAWPQFATWLRANYVAVKARAFQGGGNAPADPAVRPVDDAAYVIYVRRGSDLMPAAARLP